MFLSKFSDHGRDNEVSTARGRLEGALQVLIERTESEGSDESDVDVTDLIHEGRRYVYFCYKPVTVYLQSFKQALHCEVCLPRHGKLSKLPCERGGDSMLIKSTKMTSTHMS